VNKSKTVSIVLAVALVLVLASVTFALTQKGKEEEKKEGYYDSMSDEYYLYVEQEPTLEGTTLSPREEEPKTTMTLVPEQIAEQIRQGIEYDQQAYEEWASNFTDIPTTIYPVVLENETTFNIPMPRSLANVFNRTSDGAYVEQFATVFMQKYYPSLVAGVKGLINIPREGIRFFVSGLSRITERLQRGSEELYEPEFEAIQAIQPFNIPSKEMQEAGETVEQLFEKEQSGERLSILNRLDRAIRSVFEPEPREWSPFQE